ncbi:uncharacterized protein LOC144803687 [Lissotriton helveticus]
MDTRKTAGDITSHDIRKYFLRSQKNPDQSADPSGDGSQGESDTVPASKPEDQPTTRPKRSQKDCDQPADAASDGSQGESATVPASQPEDQPATRRTRSQKNSDQPADASGDESQGEGASLPASQSEDQPATRRTRSQKNCDQPAGASVDGSQGEGASLPASQSEDQPATMRKRSQKNCDQTADASGVGSEVESASLPASQSEVQPATMRKNVKLEKSPEVPVSQSPEPGMGKKTREPQQKERSFKFQIKNIEKAITVNGAYDTPVISAIQKSEYFQNALKKSKKKGLLLHASSKLQAMVKSNMPCALMPQDELVIITFIKGEQRMEDAVSGSDLKLFYVEPKGETENGAIRIILECEPLRSKNVRLAVCGHPNQDLRETLTADGRFMQEHLQNAFELRQTDGRGGFESTITLVRHLKEVPYKMIVTNDRSHTVPQVNGGLPAEDSVDLENALEEEVVTEDSSSRKNVKLEKSPEVPVSQSPEPGMGKKTREPQLTADGRFMQEHLQNAFELRQTDGRGGFESTITLVRHLKEVPYKMIVTKYRPRFFQKANGGLPEKESFGLGKAPEEVAGTEDTLSRKMDRSVPYFEKELLERYPRLIDQGRWLEKALKADSKATKKSRDFIKVFKEQFGKEINDSTPIAVHEMLTELGRSVGYVTWPGIPSKHPSATCFVLKGEFIITNHHVIQQIVGVGNTKEEMWSQTIRERAKIHFVHTHGVPDDKDGGWFSVKSLTKCYDRDLDYAILQLEKGEGIPPGLAATIPRNIPNDLIYIIGHPDGGVKATDTCKIIPYPAEVFEIRLKEGTSLLCHPANCAGVFPQGDFNCLHLMNQRYSKTPGEEFPELQREDKLAYDTSFFWGSSGSPVFTSMGGLIALHTCGYIGKFKWRPKHLLEFGTSMSAISSHVEKTDKELNDRLFYEESNVPMQKMAHQNRIHANVHNSKELFTIIMEFAKPSRETTDVPPSQELCNKLNTYILHMIRLIYNIFNTHDPATEPDTTAPNHTAPKPTLSNWTLLTKDDTLKTIHFGAPSDLCLHCIIHRAATAIAPELHLIINCSIKNATLPNDCKQAKINPLQKKPSNDQQTSKTSKTLLSFSAKVIEKAISTHLSKFIECIMSGSYHFGEEGDFEEEGSDFFEQDLVEALDKGVQLSMNRAMARAITPLKRHLTQYAQQQGWLPSKKSSSPGNPHSSDFRKLARSLSSKSKAVPVLVESDDHDASSSSSEVLPPPPKKRKCKDHFVDASSRPPVLTFEPEDIVHPNSSAWLPSPAVADYVQQYIRHPFDKDVRARLRSECPRPDLADNLADTPEVDPTILTYMTKFSKDPKKGLDRSWRACQDKVLDLLGPITKMLDLGFRAKEASSTVDPDELIQWAQRAVCFLGNANCALSSERRRSILLKLDPKLSELSSSEAGAAAQGLLFGQSFLKELTHFVSTFSSIDKAQATLKRAMRPVFNKAGRNWGRSSGRGQYQSTQRGNQSQKGGHQDSGYAQRSNFYPSRKGRGQFKKGGSGGYSGGRQDSAASVHGRELSTPRVVHAPQKCVTGATLVTHFSLHRADTDKSRVGTSTTADMDKKNTTEDVKSHDFLRSRKHSYPTAHASGDGSQGESSSLPESQLEDQPVTRPKRSRKHSYPTSHASGDGSQGESASLPESQLENQPVTRPKNVKLEKSPEVPVSQSPELDMGKKTTEPQQKERSFKFQMKNKENTISVDGAYNTSVISVIKNSEYFQTELEKSKNKGILLHASTKLKAMVKSNMPCGLIPQDELVIITFIKGEQRTEDVVSRCDAKVFFVKPNGETKKKRASRIILECEHLRSKNECLAVCGHPNQNLREALIADGRFMKQHLLNTFYLRPTKGSGDFEPTSQVRHLKEVPYKMIVTNAPPRSFQKANGGLPAEDSVGRENALEKEAVTEGTVSRKVQMRRMHQSVPYFEKELLEQYPKLIDQGQWLEKAFKADSKATKKSSDFFTVFKEQFGKEINNSTPIAVHEILADRGRSVGYVTWPGIPSKHPSATCFVLKGEFIITNHHVIQKIVGVGNTKEEMWSQTIRERVKIHFVHTHGVPDERDGGWFSVKTLTKCYDRDLDYAILQLEKEEGIPPGLAATIPSNIPNDLIYIIGHPDGGVKATDTCKIISYPAEVFEMRLKEGTSLLCHPANCAGVFPQEVCDCFHSMSQRYCETAGKSCKELKREDKLAYDTSFFWGSSGSPVFSSMGGLIALHTCGYTAKFQWRPKHLLEFGTFMSAIRSHVETTDKELYEKLFCEEKDVMMQVG